MLQCYQAIVSQFVYAIVDKSPSVAEQPKKERRQGEGEGGDLMMPHPGVARTLYRAKKDLITRSQLDPHATFPALEWETPIH